MNLLHELNCMSYAEWLLWLLKHGERAMVGYDAFILKKSLRGILIFLESYLSQIHLWVSPWPHHDGASVYFQYCISYKTTFEQTTIVQTIQE